MYLITLPLQLLSTGAFLEQGSTALTAISAVHAGFVAATFWALLGNAIVSTQVVEDGTMSSCARAIVAFLARRSASAAKVSAEPGARARRSRGACRRLLWAREGFPPR